MRAAQGGVLLAIITVAFAVAPQVAATGAPDAGCTYSRGYWKNHHAEWHLPLTSTTCGLLWVDILETSVEGDAWYILAHQAIAARLNPQELLTPAEATALGDAFALLDARCTSIPMGGEDHVTALILKGVLETFNLNGRCNGAL